MFENNMDSNMEMSEEQDSSSQEIERLKFLEQSLRTKIITLSEQHSEVKRQLMYLENEQNKPIQVPMSVIQKDNFQDISGQYLNLEPTNKKLYNNYFEDDDEIYDEEDDDQLNEQNVNENKIMDSEIFQDLNNTTQPKQLEMSFSSQPIVSLFPKLMRQKQPQQYRESPIKKRMASLLQPKKQYPFKKMKPHPNDEPDIVYQKLAMRDKYEKFLKKLKQEMPYYISDYGQIRYPDYVKKKVAFFCRYISRSKLVQDTRIGAEAVAKWVKVYSEYMDDKLEEAEPHETFEEYIKNRQNKSNYLIKKQQLNIQPNPNQAILKQVVPVGWSDKGNFIKNKQKEKFKFKKL